MTAKDVLTTLWRLLGTKAGDDFSRDDAEAFSYVLIFLGFTATMTAVATVLLSVTGTTPFFTRNPDMRTFAVVAKNIAAFLTWFLAVCSVEMGLKLIASYQRLSSKK